ncbi:MAG TPA: hypothetical protein VFP12_03925 [Allosphingosinicella sp.]|nr:hypothetical protein [Allosphingosinicella sp.]
MKSRNVIMDAIKLIAISQLLWACSSTVAPRAGCEAYLQRLLEKNPEVEAERIALLPTPYILGIQGYTITFPGTEDSPYAHKLRSEAIEGTSDSNLDASCVLYQRKATDYAQRYNRRLLRLLQDKLKQ